MVTELYSTRLAESSSKTRLAIRGEGKNTIVDLDVVQDRHRATIDAGRER